MTSLFERIGGDAAVSAAVDRFYERVLADERIRHFFVGIDMKKQLVHQKAFLKYAFGGLPNLPGRSMRDAHRHLVEKQGLNASHFDAVLEDLRGALEDLSVPADLVAEVITLAESTRADVLNL
jgi:hemoglobin